MKSCYSKGGLAKRGQGIATKGFAKGGLAKRGQGIATKGFAKGGLASSNVPAGGDVSASGPDTAGPQGTVMRRPVSKSVKGDSVEVRGVGAARARKATIY